VINTCRGVVGIEFGLLFNLQREVTESGRAERVHKVIISVLQQGFCLLSCCATTSCGQLLVGQTHSARSIAVVSKIGRFAAAAHYVSQNCDGSMEVVQTSYRILDETVRQWATIRTAARWEKKAAEILGGLSIPVFLPTFRRIVRYKTRKGTSEIPIFSGYLFFDETRLDELNRLSPAAKKYVAQVLRTSDQDLLNSELRTLSSVLNNYELIQSKMFGAIGDSVRVKTGVFSRYEGQIVRYGATHNRLVLSVSYLGLSVEVEIDDRNVEKLN
jgi:transcription antitermination factor NusG